MRLGAGRTLRATRTLSAGLVTTVALALGGSALAIIGGSPDNGAHPYVGAALQDQGGGTELCSGFLLSPTVFVAAAHCFPDGSTVQITFDENALESSNFIPGVVHTDPKFCFVCGHGVPNADTNDLAVVVLSTPVTLPRYAQLPKPGQSATLPNNTPIDVVGYGIQAFDKNGKKAVPTAFGTRQAATTKAASAGTLSPQFIKLLGGPGICQGDSGGPNLIGGTDTVIAETSFTVGKPNCNGNSYSERIDTPEALAFISSFL